jgi:hypothetical protein
MVETRENMKNDKNILSAVLTTEIQISNSTKNKLSRFGKKGDTYESIILQLLGEEE